VLRGNVEQSGGEENVGREIELSSAGRRVVAAALVAISRASLSAERSQIVAADGSLVGKRPFAARASISRRSSDPGSSDPGSSDPGATGATAATAATFMAYRRSATSRQRRGPGDEQHPSHTTDTSHVDKVMETPGDRSRYQHRAAGALRADRRVARALNACRCVVEDER
jgi:hypothetical protein